MEAYALTDIGRVRTMNQDYIYSSPEKVGSLPNLFLVADGMGGHRAGDYASRFAVENLVIYINRAGDGSPVMQLKKGIEAVNGMLYEESLKREELKGMGCTLVAGVVEDNILYVANVGDSRLYLIHGDSIHQVTRDHSYVEEMVAIGQMRRGSEDYNGERTSSPELWESAGKWSLISLRWIWRAGIIFCSVPMVSATCWRTSPCMKSSQEREALRKRQPFL